MTTTTLPRRADLRPEDTWAVETIFPDPVAWEAAYAEAKAMVPRLTAYRGTIAQGARQLLDCLRTRDELGRLADRLFVYAHLRRDEDTTNATFQALADRAASLSVEVGAAQAFIDPELLELSDETLARYYREEPALELYRHAIDQVVRLRPHTRSAEVEELLAQSREVGRAPGEIYTMFNDADLKFPAIRDEQGNEIEVTHGRFLRLMESQDRRVRRDTFDALYSTYAKFRNTTATTLAAAVRRNVFYARAHRYSSALEAALFPNQIPTAVYHQLIETVRRGLPLLHRYMALRRRVLGLDAVHMYDIYVPLVPEVDRDIPWGEATATVVAAFRPLGERYTGLVAEGLRNRWVDVYENEGKASGAYSWGAYDTQPFILMNYQNNWNSVFTLAHELGHSLHSYLTRSTQPYIYGDYTTFLAEIASTLNEALLVEHLLTTTTDPKLRAFVINHQLEAFRGTLFRQTMFAEFELAIHERVERGEALTADGLSALYYDLVRAYHGPEVVADEPIALEWSRIPHFYMNFYVFQYATGISAASALARQIAAEGAPAIERYLTLLSSGSSDYSVPLLQRAGVDMTTPEPIEAALGLFARRLDEAEQLLA